MLCKKKIELPAVCYRLSLQRVELVLNAEC